MILVFFQALQQPKPRTRRTMPARRRPDAQEKRPDTDVQLTPLHSRMFSPEESAFKVSYGSFKGL